MRIVGEFSHCPVQGMKVLMCIITYMPEHSQNTMCQMDVKEKLGVKFQIYKFENCMCWLMMCWQKIQAILLSINKIFINMYTSFKTNCEPVY